MKSLYLLSILCILFFTPQAQNVGIGTNTPNVNALLHVDLSLSTSKGFLISGTYDATSTVPNLGAGSRLSFFPGKAAFRVGRVFSTEWDNVNVGLASIAFGSGTTASGTNATAMGYQTTASGNYATSMGYLTSASGTYATSMGQFTSASGGMSTALGLNTSATSTGSVALGQATLASGYTATAMGYSTTATQWGATSMGINTDATGYASSATGLYTKAKGYATSVVGMYNDSLLTINENQSASPQTPMFMVGNGDDASTRSNALVILKSGNVGIGNNASNTSAILDVSSTTKGLLIPRMSRVSRDAISSPATSLLIFQTTETPGFVYNAGTPLTPNWVRMSRKLDTLVVGAEAFYPSQSSVAYTTNALSARYVPTDGSTADLRAAINLPSGVTINTMKVYYYDESASANLTVELRENYLAQGFYGSTPFSYTSSGSLSSLRTANVYDSYVVQNNLYSYYLYVRPPVGSWNFGGDISIKGVMIIYEY